MQNDYQEHRREAANKKVRPTEKDSATSNITKTTLDQ